MYGINTKQSPKIGTKILGGYAIAPRKNPKDGEKAPEWLGRYTEIGKSSQKLST